MTSDIHVLQSPASKHRNNMLGLTYILISSIVLIAACMRCTSALRMRIHYRTGTAILGGRPSQPVQRQGRGHNNDRARMVMQCVDSTEEASRNIPFDGILNMRDLAGATSTIPFTSSKLYRCGCVSKASNSDCARLSKEMQMQSLIDLRSEKEWEEDEHLHGTVYNGHTDLVFDVKKGIYTDRQGNAVDVAAISGPRRYFVPLTSESLIKKGTFKKLRKRTRAKALAFYALSPFSRRAEKKMRSYFIDKINGGGLAFLNELVVDGSGKGVAEVLKIIANGENLPSAVYCTAGKDRTGLVSMLVLKIMGASIEEILDDYELSDSVYKDMNDSKAMVVSLKQAEVDPEIFLGAKREVMEHTITYIQSKYGSIEGYLDDYGFNETWREKLRQTLKK